MELGRSCAHSALIQNLPLTPKQSYASRNTTAQPFRLPCKLKFHTNCPHVALNEGLGMANGMFTGKRFNIGHILSFMHYLAKNISNNCDFTQ